jgi:TolB-like protein
LRFSSGLSDEVITIFERYNWLILSAYDLRTTIKVKDSPGSKSI